MPFSRKKRLSGADSFSPPMPKSQGVNSISQNYSFVILCTQRNFGHVFREQMVVPAAEKTLFSHLVFFCHQTFHEVRMSQALFDHAFFHSFCFLFFPDFFIHLHQERIQFRLQCDKFCHYRTFAFIFHQPNLFVVFRHDWQPFKSFSIHVMS